MRGIVEFAAGLALAAVLVSASEAGQAKGAPGQGQQGLPGQGQQGQPGTTGQPGTPAQPGTTGQPGAIGQGQPGQPGTTGQPGVAGQQGQPGIKSGTGGVPNQQISGYNGAQTPWFNNPDVRKQLNLNNDQYNGLNKSYEQYWSQYQKGLSGLGNMDEQTRAQQAQELRNNFNSQVMKSAQGVLTPEQVQRFNQLNLQSQGGNAFNDPTVQQKLNLTADQKAKLRALSQQQDQTMSNLQKQYGTDPQAARQQYDASRKQYNDSVNAILNQQQQQTWQQLTGQPYTFTPEWMQKK